jgi:hypothetical protein
LTNLSTLEKCQAIFPRAFRPIHFVTAAQYWVAELKKYEPTCRIALVGCKSDLSAKTSQTKINAASEDSASALPHSNVTMR